VITDSFRDFVPGQLAGLNDRRSRRLFGGYGLDPGDTFFGILFDGLLHFQA
jgi:TfoX/Sxy family transcriptional regulator of competence genes